MAATDSVETMENAGKLLHSIDLIDPRTGASVKGGEALKDRVTIVAIAPYWLPMPLRQSLASVSEHTDQLRDEGKPVAFVYVPQDRDETFINSLKARGQTGILDERPDQECFQDLCKQLVQGWLAVPLEESATRSTIVKNLKSGIFAMAIIGPDGETLTKDGMEMLYKWGSQGYPFTPQRIEELEKEAKDRAANQSLKAVLVTPERDFVIKNDKTQVKVETLEGKYVGLYFSAHWCGPCRRFTPVLVDLYNKLKARGEDFEVVFVSSDKDEEAFEEYHKEMPWLAIPFSDTKQRKLLDRWFEVEGIPMLVILDKDGKTVNTEAVELIFKHGIDAYPFTPQKLAELKAEEDRKRAEQTLESILVTQSRDFVISGDGKEVKVSELKGKTVGLYFSAHWCPPCRGFTPSLINVYKELKEKRNAEFEIIFISSDRDEEAFKSYYHSMPWLALPFSDRQAKSSLSSYFDVQGIPTLVIIGPDGKTVTTDARGMVGKYKADAFPFTNAHIESLDEKLNQEAARMPKEIKHSSHPEHPLVLLADAYNGRPFGCDLCDGDGTGWVYHCSTCSFDLHPHCAKPELESKNKEHGNEAKAPEGWVCEGDVCRKL